METDPKKIQARVDRMRQIRLSQPPSTSAEIQEQFRQRQAQIGGSVMPLDSNSWPILKRGATPKA